VFKRGVSPSSLLPSPSPFKERGIKGVRLMNNLKRATAKNACQVVAGLRISPCLILLITYDQKAIVNREEAI